MQAASVLVYMYVCEQQSKRAFVHARVNAHTRVRVRANFSSSGAIVVSGWAEPHASQSVAENASPQDMRALFASNMALSRFWSAENVSWSAVDR